MRCLTGRSDENSRTKLQNVVADSTAVPQGPHPPINKGRKAEMNQIVIAAATLLLQMALPTESVVSRELNERIAYMKDHFGEMQFKPEGGFILRKGQPLPDLVWDEPEVASALLSDTIIPTRWFDSELNEVTKADKAGRYYAYGEAPAPEGAPLYRAMTCLCLDEDENLERLALRLNPGQEARVQQIVKAWREDEERTITLCGKLETEPPYEPKRPGQWQMENATVHVRLKRKIRNIKRQVEVKARALVGPPAPVLSGGKMELTHADREFKTKMEELYERWHQSSGQPMSVVVARKGNIIVSRGYGEMGGKPVTVNTPMLLHSAMKPIMGLQLAMYIDRGIVALDEPIGNYLPEFDTPRDKKPHVSRGASTYHGDQLSVVARLLQTLLFPHMA